MSWILDVQREENREENKTNKQGGLYVLATFTNYNATAYRGSSLIRGRGVVI